MNQNMYLKSYFHQLALANGVKGFSLVTDNALTPRYDVKRISAPPAINGATRKFLSPQDDDAAPSYPSRRRSSGVESFQRANGSFMRWSAPSSLESTKKNDSDDRFSAGSMMKNPNSLLETVFDEVDSILYEEGDHHRSVESDDFSSPGEKESQKNGKDEKPMDTRFDSNFHRFSVDRFIEAPPRAMPRAPSVVYRQREMERPKLPVRQESVDDFSPALNRSDSPSVVSSTCSSVSVSIATGSSFPDMHLPVPPIQASYVGCVSIEETTSWHEDDDEEGEGKDGDAEQEAQDSANPTTLGAQSSYEPKGEGYVDDAQSAPTRLEVSEDMASPPPLVEPSPVNDESSKYSLRRRANRRRRSSLDTGHTFRNSFSSQNSEDDEDCESKSRWN